MKVLVIIPARGGSKGVPGKNIKVLGDKPLVIHAIDCAKKSNKVSEIVVTTDSDAVIDVVKNQGITVLKRPENLAQDDSNVVTAVNHCIETLENSYDLIVLLQPTSPFRTEKDLDAIIEMFENDADLEGVVSVAKVEEPHPARMYHKSEENYLSSYAKDEESKRRQDLDILFHRNGCFYAVTTAVFLKQKSLMPEHKKAYIMDADWVVNIDKPRDFAIATLLYQDWIKFVGNV
ncbi:NTP transferase domain-containing protein [Flavobacterium sp. NST-5]|uniref:NTP transferase domain-containing protein n=1 Tax=Flavobacterium ichthyis TaxID=2698827 RepID=A0ABW9Z7K6_9FLAO|nr:acylneuraminate cytidylyltransferase family protein [Flavobacterium ichthyis]NBL64840.1 NTP transferase domain-containing protein [Flavobacterium ichthyis]